MRILVACLMPENALEQLRGPGADVIYVPDLPADQLPEHIADVSILIVDRRRVAPETIHAGKALQLIVRAGTLVSNVAIEAASEQGVFVCNCPFRDASAIAELVIAQLIALDRQLLPNALAAREGLPRSIDPGHARGITGASLGIMGWCPVGREIALRARAFEMKVRVWSPTFTPGAAGDREVEFTTWPRELASSSDFVAIFAPPDRSEGQLITSEFVQTMRPGACLAHVGVASALDEEALSQAVKAGKIRVASDIYEPDAPSEAGRVRSRLLDAPGVLLTRRVGGITRQAQASVAQEVVRIVREFTMSGSVINCVNLLERSPATWQLVMRLRDAVGVMASIMDAIRADGINAEEITSRVFAGARAVWCAIALDERPSTDALAAIRSLPGVLHLELRAVV